MPPFFHAQKDVAQMHTSMRVVWTLPWACSWDGEQEGAGERGGAIQGVKGPHALGKKKAGRPKGNPACWQCGAVTMPL